jgi:putative FmdB family regulatory protein
MPMYEYVCQECQHGFETLVFGNERVECPQCKSPRLQKTLSLPGRPKVTASLPAACKSEGPPCGPACSRWQG